MAIWRGCVMVICSVALTSVILIVAAGEGTASAGGFTFVGQNSDSYNATQSSAGQQENPPTHYTLTPEQRAKAVAYAQARYTIYFCGVALSLGIYFLFWRARIAQAFRNWARSASARPFVQSVVFVPLFFAAVAVIELPLDYYSGFVIEHRFGISTQSLASWLADWAKGLGITLAAGIFIVWILYAVIRRSPRRWWFYFWLVTIPLALGLILIEPLVIDPLFFKFTPLEKTQPALVERIEAMLHHAGLEIPPSRIFEMNASTKTKALNAYVNGIGASKRVVVWDTTLRKLDEDETLLVLGHETGHYVLGHVAKGFVIFELGALVAFWIGFLLVGRIVKRWGPKTGVEGAGDLASFPVLLLVLTALSFLSSPIYCSFSRRVEHQADQFGLEVAYGVVHDPNAAEARSLQILGEEDLEEPAPSPFIKFWLYTHPPLDERIRFAISYKPWAEGKPMELVRPR